jgi:TorA maturation chaperone TorD
VLLRHPDANTAKWLVAREHHRLPEVLERVGANGRMSEQARRLLKMLDTAALPDLTRQHELTFGHAVQGTAPPYELEYGEEHSHRQPQELSDIAAFYAAFGLRIAASSHERVDHIGTECEFLHYLLYKQACAADEDADEQARVCEEAGRRFLADHLGQWGPAFALRLPRVAGDPPPRPPGLALGRPERVPSLPRDESKDDGWLRIAGALLLEWLSQECTRMDVPLGSCDLPLRSPKEQDEVGCAACALPQGRGDGSTTCAVPPKAGQVAGTDEVM